MGCQDSVFIGDNITFSVCTHDPDTGQITYANAPPTYDIYEDNTSAPILSGSMVKHNAKTGFYLQMAAATTGNGFKNGKSYNIEIVAAVGGISGGISFGFRAESRTGSGGGSAGAKDKLYIRDSMGNPVADCEVWLTSDLDGTTVVRGPLVSEDDGSVEFLVDIGVTYYCWRKKSGVNFTNPVLFVAVGV